MKYVFSLIFLFLLSSCEMSESEKQRVASNGTRFCECRGGISYIVFYGNFEPAQIVCNNSSTITLYHDSLVFKRKCR